MKFSWIHFQTLSWPRYEGSAPNVDQERFNNPEISVTAAISAQKDIEIISTTFNLNEVKVL